MANRENQFQIYGRTSYEQPLTFITEIACEQPTSDQAVQAKALAAVGEEKWLELIAMPVESLLTVIGGEEGPDSETPSEDGTGGEAHD